MEGGLSFDKPMFNQMGGRERHQNPNRSDNDGKIVFAPQIVVTTGNDNNTTIPNTTTPTDGTELSSGSQGSPAAFNGEPSVVRNISMNKMEPVMDSALEPAQKPAEPASSAGGGLLDFAKGFFIKKMI